MAVLVLRVDGVVDIYPDCKDWGPTPMFIQGVGHLEIKDPKDPGSAVAVYPEGAWLRVSEVPYLKQSE